MSSCFEVGRRSYEEELEEDQCGWSPESEGKEYKTRGRVGREHAVQDEVGCISDASFLPGESGQLRS